MTLLTLKWGGGVSTEELLWAYNCGNHDSGLYIPFNLDPRLQSATIIELSTTTMLVAAAGLIFCNLAACINARHISSPSQ